MKILIIEARFYADICDSLLDGATKYLDSKNINYDKISVPGAFEIPAAISMAASTEKYNGYIALGCVIRGETTHYDYVCQESARGLMELSVKEKLPIGYGILTVENKDQAWERADINKGNKGADAADACIRMFELKKDLVSK